MGSSSLIDIVGSTFLGVLLLAGMNMNRLHTRTIFKHRKILLSNKI